MHNRVRIYFGEKDSTGATVQFVSLLLENKILLIEIAGENHTIIEIFLKSVPVFLLAGWLSSQVLPLLFSR